MTVARTHNPYEAERREMKVRSLINALEAAYILALGKRAEAESMLEAATTFTELQWKTLDELAKVKRPASDETRAAVVAELRKRVEDMTSVRRQVSQYERDCDDEGQGLAARKGWEIE